METEWQQQTQGPQRRKIEDVLVSLNKAAIRSLLEDVYSNGDLRTLERIVAKDVRIIDNALLEPLEGIAQYRAQVEQSRRAFPDLRCAIDDLVAEGDRVAVRWVASGTNSADSMGLRATGRTVRDVSGASTFRLADGKIVEARTIWDVASLLEQLGVGGGAQLPTKASVDAARQALSSWTTSFSAAFDRSDAAAIASNFLEDATLITPDGKLATGRPAIQKAVEENLASFLGNAKNTFTLNHARLLAPRLAVVDFTHEIVGPNVPNGKIQFHVDGVVRKVNDRWMWLDARPHPYLQQP